MNASLGQADLAPHCAPGIRCELPAPNDDHDRCRRYEQTPGTDEPAEIVQGKKEGALAPIEMPTRGLEHSRGPYDVRFGLRRVALCGRRHRAEQDGDIVEQPVGPGEFEERVDEN